MKNIKLNKKSITIILSCLIVVIAAIVICILFFNKNNQEKILTNKLGEMGTEFYEEFYYNQIGSNDEERSNFLKKFESTGIKVNLDNLSRYSGQDSEKVLEEFINTKSNKKCDKINSQVIIYPEAPYSKSSYRLEVKLDCGFEK